MNVPRLLRTRIVCSLILLVQLVLISELRAISASPEPVDVSQPDGTKITLAIKGDEYFHWYEDGDGFTVVRDAARKYVYAGLDAGGRLAPTALMVGKIDPKAVGIARGILPSKAILAAEREEMLWMVPHLDGNSGEAPDSGPPPSLVPPQGTVRNLVVLCKFANHVTGTHTRSQADYDILFNSPGGHATIAPSGSVKDYYTEASYATLDLQSTVVAWVTLPENESYYADGKDGTDGTYPKNAQGMVEDALDLVDPLVDFGQFDQDNDGLIDSITIIHSGYGAETGGGNGDWIWSHRWSLWALPGGRWTSQDLNGASEHVSVSDYHTEPALWGTSGTEIVRIGVICHETGHFFGLPDLYDTDGSSSGIGSWCLMANSWGFDGTQLHPPHPSAWCKQELGWVTPTEIVGGTYSAPQVETNATVYKITTGFPSGEYLLIENRQPVGFETAIPQGGLAVWHIDLNKPSNRSEGYPGQAGWPANNNHFKVALLQADGLYELEKRTNRGNAGDLYRAGGVSAITPATLPSTDRYQDGAVATSNNTITGISASGTTMTFALNGANGEPVIISASAASAPPDLPFSYQIAATGSPTSYNATGLPAGLAVNTGTGLISGTPGTIGVYPVGLSATNANGTGTATLTLTIAEILTLEDALDTTGMTWVSGGDSEWTTQTLTTHDGQDAGQSGPLGTSQASYVETTVTGPGALSFWWKVSSEGGYDYLRFTLDGVAPGGVGGISGEVGWQQQTVSITAGSHTLKWEYSKDGSVDRGDDTGWVDEVSFSAGVQPPVITSVTTANGVLDQTFSYQITATNMPTSYGATGLPAGLTVDTSSGLISGSPTALGSFDVGLSATNSAATGNATLALTVTATALTLADAVDAPSLPWTTGGAADWLPQVTTTHDGLDAGEGGDIADGEESWMETTVTGPGSLSFWWKVSSESGYDYLRFLVDGAEQVEVPRISGAVDWQQVNVSVGLGSHVLRWRYSKDGSVSSGSDTGWVDELVFTATNPAPEIAVEDPGGMDLADGVSSVSFGSTVRGTSRSVVFTILNPGSLDLTGLGITIDGTDAGEFSVTAAPAASVVPGASTSFTVEFAPAALGARTANLHVASNDADEDPFDIELTGVGIDPITELIDDFDPDYDAGLWAEFGGTFEANTNGQAAGAGTTGNSLWFGGEGSRFATTLPVDTSAGGDVSFLVAIADGADAPWEAADADEGVVLEYSTDGLSFVQIGGPYDNTTWQPVTVVIPAAAQTVATQFRFRQLGNSGTDYDHWAIDDVEIGVAAEPVPSFVVLPSEPEWGSQLNIPVWEEPRTIQYVFDSSLLASLPVGGGFTGMAFRLNGGVAAWPAAACTWASYDIRISSSLNSPGGLSTTFGSNIGPDVVMVRSGPLTIPDGTYPGGASPNDFGPEIVFDTPYIYTGGDLLVTLRHSGNGTDWALLDAATEVAGEHQGIYAAGTDAYTATTSTGSSSVPVTRFNYTLSQLQIWRALNFTAAELADPAISGLLADPDMDGITNAFEYVLGLEPRTVDAHPWRGGVESVGPDRFLSISFNVPQDFRPDAVLTVEGSHSLGTGAVWTTLATKSGGAPWTTSNGGAITEGAVVNGRSLVTVRSSDAIGDPNEREFLRLRVVVP